MTASANSSGRSVLTPNQRHTVALDRRRAKLARAKARDASPDAVAKHQAAVDRLVMIKAKAEERAARKAEHAELEAHFAAKEAAEDSKALAGCRVIIERIERRGAAERDRRKLETPQDRRASRLRRLAPHIERDAAIQPGKRLFPDPSRIGGSMELPVNRRVDVLAQERSQGRISEASFQVGRMVQAVFERGSGARLGSAGWDIGGSRDQTNAHELSIIYAVEDANQVRKFVDRMTEAVGGVGVRFLRAILAEGETFAGYAARTGKGNGDRAASDVAKRFRWLLEALTEEQHTATGAEGQRIRATREPCQR